MAIALSPQPIAPGTPPVADLAQRFATAAAAVEAKQAGGWISSRPSPVSATRPPSSTSPSSTRTARAG
uniref:Uncharacterized protein n=1 Tax=Phenylobacterium glaciei TaxID=2803784 RepID=A0A974P4T7_9CAUL|nr:hypothetical protein JKL49_07275 [Phenylobacterium glaciei]